MSQAQFAASFGFGLDAVQNWKQGRRRLEGAGRAFLKVIEREPEAVLRAAGSLKLEESSECVRASGAQLRVRRQAKAPPWHG